MLKATTFIVGLAIAAATLPTTAVAGSPGTARWFRYYDDRKQPVITDTVTPDHITHGYDELTERMSLIRHVEAQRPLTPEEKVAQKQKAEQAAQRARDDKQMLRLYAGPSDAERARNRQLDALQVRIDFASNSLTGLRQRRAGDAQRAATLERTGKAVPPDLKQSIANYDKQIAATQAEVNDRKAEQKKVFDEFEPMIRRLGELTGKPVGTIPVSIPMQGATPPAAAPAAPAPAAK